VANKITTIFDFKDSGGLKKIKAEVKEADGLFGKMKAGIKGATEELKTNRTAQLATGAAAVAAAKVAIDAASDLEESVNAVKVVYQDAGDEVLKLGDTSAESFGLSQRAFNEFAVQFSAFASQIADNSGRSVVEVVEEMTTRVADFASVHNLSMEEAAQVVQSTMAGETEAFRRFGGDVSAATIKAKAYEDGIAEVGEELTEGQKVLARYSAFMEQTGETAGDFANTSDSLANQQRIMQANIEDSAAALGQDLLPVVAEAAQLANEAADAFRNWDDAFRDLSGGAGILGTAFDFGTKPLQWMNSYNNALTDFVGLTGEAEDAGVAFTRVGTDMARGQFEAATATDEAAAAVEEHTDKVTDFDRWLERATESGQKYADAAKRKADRDEEAARAAEEHKANLDALIESINEAIGAAFDYEQSNIDMARAAMDFAEQQIETTRVLNDSESGARDKEAALYDLRDAELSAAEQAWETAQAFAEEQGAAEGSTEAARLQKEELERLAQKFPYLRDEIDLFIAKLNAIPSSKTVTIQQNIRGAGVGGTIGGASYSGVRERGGPVSAGEMYRVGEGGKPELLESDGKHYLIPGDNGRVTPADSTSGAGMVGGGATYNVTVNAGMGTNGGDVGRQVVEAIRRFERANGSGWRK